MSRGTAFLVVLSVVLSTGQPLSAAEIQIFTATLTGAQEVPAVATAGTGTGTVMLNAAETQITVNLTFSGLSSNATMSHIHGAAAAGTNAGILFDFAAVTPAAMSGTIPQQTFSITPAQVADLKGGLFYFNVHTGTNPGGEIRGQIGLAATQFSTTLTGAQQVPPVSSSGTGTGTVALNAAEDLLFVNMSFSGLSSNASMAHIHGPAPAGTNAGILFDFASVTPAATSGSIPQQTFGITPAQVSELKAGLYYFNIHTTNFSGGEIRGQIGFPAITTQPASQVVATGQNAMFTVAATGAPAPTYQWQESYAGLPFYNLANGGAYSGVTTPTLTVAASSGLNAYQYRVIVSNSSGSVTSTAATLTVTTAPTVALDRTSLSFAAASSGVAFTSQTSAQTVRLTQTGMGTVTWTASSNAPWLLVSPMSGSGSATLTISTQFASGLSSSQTGNITLNFTGAGNTAGPIAVTLTVSSSGTTSAPMGSFDTPTDGMTGVSGSIAVTGWALDDVEVTRVRIMRDPVGGEPAGTLVFIGDAILVEGARPDVQQLFPTLPRNTRAGFGYLLLTNFLPALGNGTFRLHAIADDADGHSTTLGTKTIVCDNANATVPFGAIDTPVQGGTVSGNVTNFGWVLALGPRRADPPAGGTVRMVVDGAFLPQVPSGWTSRADLTALFPAAQYPGISTALGAAAFDSTALANGVHTISWVVTDDIGAAAGIGSRYFTVSNGSLFLDPAAATTVRAASVLRAPVADAPILGRRGFSLETPLQSYQVSAGRATVQAEELDRVELHLGGTEGTLAGYLRVGQQLRPLPIGSSLDPATGTFTWMPGVGFVGQYDLVFVRWAGARAIARQDVRVVLNPRGSQRVGPQTVIDVPAMHTDAGQPFVVAGWAADLDSTTDRGIEAVHVWAYPRSGPAADPIWIGAAAYGGYRPDVAAFYGDRFRDTGYGLVVRGLAPGDYDIAVFAYSTVKVGFVPAKTVRVTIRP